MTRPGEAIQRYVSNTCKNLDFTIAQTFDEPPDDSSPNEAVILSKRRRICAQVEPFLDAARSFFQANMVSQNMCL